MLIFLFVHLHYFLVVARVRDVDGVLWAEYLDEATGRSYYHEADTGQHFQLLRE